MAFARFISVEYILENTIIDKNVDATLITKFIDESQDINIQQTIGYQMYQNIMGMISGGTITNPTNVNYYYLLTNFIQKCQSMWVVYHILPYLNYHLTNKSVNTKNSTYSQPSGLNELDYLRNDVKSKAEFYVARIREYIVNNPGFYPDYWSTSGIDRILPKSLNYTGGMYLPNRKKLPISGVNISNDGLGDCSGYF